MNMMRSSDVVGQMVVEAISDDRVERDGVTIRVGVQLEVT